jgi:hypothetical protein
MSAMATTQSSASCMPSGSLSDMAFALSKSVALAAVAKLYAALCSPSWYRLRPAPAVTAAAAATPASRTLLPPAVGIAASSPSPIASKVKNNLSSASSRARLRTSQSTASRSALVACIWSSVTRRRYGWLQTVNRLPISGRTLATLSSRSCASVPTLSASA